MENATGEGKMTSLCKRVQMRSSCPSPRSIVVGVKGIDVKPKSVRFQEDERFIKEIPALSELSEKDFETLWYTKLEYQLSRKASNFIVKMMERGMGGLEDDDELCPRGLETRTRIGSQKKRGAIEDAWDVVMNEQEKQYSTRKFCDASMARLYRESSAGSSLEAFMRGKEDEESSRKLNNLPNTVTGRLDDA